MSYRELDNIDDKLIEAALSIGNEEGLCSVTARKIAERCGVSDYTVFSHMGGTKNSILDEAARYADEKFMLKLRGLCRKKPTPEQLWDEMMDYLIENPDGASYLAQYVPLRGANITKDAMRSGLLVSMADAILGDALEFEEEEILMLWDYEIMLLLFYANKFIKGEYAYDEPTKAFVKNLVFSSLLKDAGRAE